MMGRLLSYFKEPCENKVIKLIFLLIVLNFIILWYVIYKSSFFKKVTLPSFKLTTYEGKTITTEDLNAKLNILIFFTLEDCPACLFEAEFWGQASQKFENDKVKFIGITSEENGERVSRFCNAYKILFPILYDKNEDLKNKISSKLNIKVITPFKIFVSHNKIILYESPTKNAQEQREFINRVDNLVTSLSGRK